MRASTLRPSGTTRGEVLVVGTDDAAIVRTGTHVADPLSQWQPSLELKLDHAPRLHIAKIMHHNHAGTRTFRMPHLDPCTVAIPAREPTGCVQLRRVHGDLPLPIAGFVERELFQQIRGMLVLSRGSVDERSHGGEQPP